MTLPVHRRTDNCTGHGCWPPRPPSSWSPDVFANNLNQIRLTDSYVVHCCGNGCHSGVVADGSETVFANNLEYARQSDPISCGSRCNEHSPDVFAGD